MRNGTRYDIANSPGPRMREAYLAGMSIFAEEFADYGITSLQFAVMCHIRAHSGLDQVSLAERTATDRTTTAKVVRRLERRNLLVRRRGRKDGRTKCLYLTRAGVTLLARLIPRAEKVMERFFAPLSRRERDTFVALLAKLTSRKETHLAKLSALALS